jgi:general secretion pathway protein A
MIKDFHGHFGFRTLPFTREFPIDVRFELPHIQEACTALQRTIRNRMSGAIVAPAGSGKTVILRTLVSQLPEALYRVDYIKVTSLSKRDMCREIARAMGVPSAGSYPALVRNLQDRCVALTETDGLRPVLLVDEAHDMRPDVLAILRVLTNFELDSRLVVSIVLCGQPPLAAMLRSDDLEAVSRRLAHVATLRLLSRDETTRYVTHRCSIAGASTPPFDPRAIESLFEMSRGNMRAIDHLALKSLEAAHDANCATVDSSHVADARRMLWA